MINRRMLENSRLSVITVRHYNEYEEFCGRDVYVKRKHTWYHVDWGKGSKIKVNVLLNKLRYHLIRTCNRGYGTKAKAKLYRDSNLGYTLIAEVHEYEYRKYEEGYNWKK